MKRLAWALGVCLCGCAMSSWGAEVSAGGATVAESDTVVEAAAGDAKAEEPEPIRKDGVPLTDDSRYELLLTLSLDGKTDDGIYLVKHSIHVTDVVNDSIFTTVSLIEATGLGTSVVTTDFRLDGDGEIYVKAADGTYAPLSEESTVAETLAKQSVLDAFGDTAQCEGFLQEMQEIAVRKAGLDKPAAKAEEGADGAASEEIQSETEGAGQEAAAPKEEVAVPGETVSKETKMTGEKSSEDENEKEALLWKKFEERVQVMLQKEKPKREKEDRTRIDVVVPPNPNAVYEEKEVEPDNQKVTVSIQTVES